jgi:hypothetical protein
MGFDTDAVVNLFKLAVDFAYRYLKGVNPQSFFVKDRPAGFMLFDDLPQEAAVAGIRDL